MRKVSLVAALMFLAASLSTLLSTSRSRYPLHNQHGGRPIPSTLHAEG